MAKVSVPSGLIFAAITLIIGCSRPDPVWLMKAPDPAAIDSTQIEYAVIDSTDSTDIHIEKPDINESLDKAEYYYAIGVNYFQHSEIDSAQAAYEQSLAVLSDLDLDPEQSPEQAQRMEQLLNEIEQDYRLALMASGKLSSESSITAFRELFDDLKNFNKLKESAEVKTFNEADTVIYDVEIEWNQKVENSLIYLQTVARNKFTTYLARSAVYLPLMEKIFEENGMPHDLVYLPLIESGFNASAYSYAKASGFWQFISSTGKLYGLEHNWWYDERRDFEKSTLAAAQHMRDLYNQFGSWNLVLAAYNGGAGRVAREIKKANSKDFWKLQVHKQTKNYVPLFMAATIIAKQPHKYGFYPDYEKPLEYESVKINKCISFNNISAATSIPVPDLERLNPELLRGVTPPNLPEYTIRVPRGYQQVFMAAYDSIPSEKATTLVKHKVRKGETLSAVAKKYGVTVASLREANGIGKKKGLYVGQILTVPVPLGKGSSAQKNITVAEKNPNPAQKPIVKTSPNRYLVKDGDTLWEIASAYGTSIAELKRANDLNSNTVYAGRWLRIPGNGALAQDAKIQPAGVTYDIYKVKRGDSLSKIAKKYRVTTESIKGINDLPSNRLYPGMKLKIPASGSSNAQAATSKTSKDKELAFNTYTVRSGDTLWKIARTYGIGVNELAKWNNISLGKRLQPGDKLKIYFN